MNFLRANNRQGAYLAPLAGRGRIGTTMPSGVAVLIRVRGRRRLQSGCDGFQNTGHVLQDLVVPKVQNAIIVINQPCIAQDIVHIVRVLPAIDLNNQSGLPANQIDRVATNRLLPNEFMAIKRSRPQSLPQRHFGFGRVATQTPRPGRIFLSGFAHDQAPSHPASALTRECRPLPASGERLRSAICATQSGLLE